MKKGFSHRDHRDRRELIYSVISVPSVANTLLRTNITEVGNHMKCRAIQKRLSPYQDGELKPQMQELVAIHLQSCQACRKQLAEIEGVWHTLGELREIQPAPGFYKQVREKINEPHKRSSLVDFTRIVQLFPTPLVTVTLLIVGIISGAYLGHILVRNGLFPSDHNPAGYARESIYLASLRVFDPNPPGTLSNAYLLMISDNGKEYR